jgi:hypothetical protein
MHHVRLAEAETSLAIAQDDLNLIGVNTSAANRYGLQATERGKAFQQQGLPPGPNLGALPCGRPVPAREAAAAWPAKTLARKATGSRALLFSPGIELFVSLSACPCITDGLVDPAQDHRLGSGRPFRSGSFGRRPMDLACGSTLLLRICCLMSMTKPVERVPSTQLLSFTGDELCSFSLLLWTTWDGIRTFYAHTPVLLTKNS